MAQRKRYDANFKATVALEAAKETNTLAELSSKYGVHANQITKWKQHLLNELPEIFKNKARKDKKEKELQNALYQEIGQLKVELDWLKKNAELTLEDKRQAVEPEFSPIPVYRQCELLGLTRSTYYYKPSYDTEYNEYIMRLIDEQYMRTPFFGSPQMTNWLKNQKNENVNHKRIERLMRQMGLKAVCPGPHTSRKHSEHKVYPYLLKNVEITYPDQVWASDITYIPMKQGFLYLVAIIDCFSRYVLSWRLSNTLDTGFVVQALEEALKRSIPYIFNSDQGVQYTSEIITNILKDMNINISMSAKGRCFDNILIERLWRSLKYEEVYLKEYIDGQDAYKNIHNYFKFHNFERPHKANFGVTPYNTYIGV